MGMQFEWADIAKGARAEIWTDEELAEVAEDGFVADLIGVSMDTGSNGCMLYGERDALIGWAEDLAARLRAGEGVSKLGEVREFVFMGGQHRVQDADGDVYEAEELEAGQLLRDNSGDPVDDDTEEWPELTGATWKVMSTGFIGRSADGRGGFIVPTRKVGN